MANEKRLIAYDPTALESLTRRSKPYNLVDMGYIEAASKIKDWLESQPLVDAVEVVHGRWIHVPSSDMMTGKAYKCSECGKMRYGSYMPNYCQCCGAKMDGDEDDNDT